MITQINTFAHSNAQINLAFKITTFSNNASYNQLISNIIVIFVKASLRQTLDCSLIDA